MCRSAINFSKSINNFEKAVNNFFLKKHIDSSSPDRYVINDTSLVTVSYHKIACLQYSSSKRTVYYQLFKSYSRSGSTTSKVIDFVNRDKTCFQPLEVQKGGS